MSSRKYGSGREDLPDVLECSGGPPGSPGVIGRPTQMSASGREALRYALEWSGSPSGCPGMVGSPSLMFGSGREVLPEVRL